MAHRIEHKADYLPLLRAGALGNTAYVWNSVDEAIQSDFIGNVMVRYRGSGTKRFWQPNIPKVELPEAIDSLVRQGAIRDMLYVGEWIPTEWVVINGVLATTDRHLDLLYSEVKAPLRESIEAGGVYLTGLQANAALRYFLDDTRYEFLLRLLSDYQEETTEPRPIIEFTLFNRAVGTWPDHLVIWEVRTDWTPKILLPWPQ